MTDYKGKLGSLADKLKKEIPPTPIQAVHPVKAPEQEPEKELRFNNWIPRSLKKQLKAYAAEADITLKELNIQALKEYLKNRDF
ncbi:hypothetical protein GCM10027037_23220 [Mucilaginibacter koreensis]